MYVFAFTKWRSSYNKLKDLRISHSRENIETNYREVTLFILECSKYKSTQPVHII